MRDIPQDHPGEQERQRIKKHLQHMVRHDTPTKIINDHERIQRNPHRAQSRPKIAFIRQRLWSIDHDERAARAECTMDNTTKEKKKI